MEEGWVVDAAGGARSIQSGGQDTQKEGSDDDRHARVAVDMRQLALRTKAAESLFPLGKKRMNVLEAGIGIALWQKH
jgi:hypothetical protein